jgi:hypothetical protein
LKGDTDDPLAIGQTLLDALGIVNDLLPFGFHASLLLLFYLFEGSGSFAVATSDDLLVCGALPAV